MRIRKFVKESRKCLKSTGKIENLKFAENLWKHQNRWEKLDTPRLRVGYQKDDAEGQNVDNPKM